MISTVIADDSELMRQKMRVVCRGISAIDIIAETDNGDAAYDLVMRLKPDLLLTDVQMFGITGLEVAQRLIDSTTKVVLCTSMGQAGVVQGFPKIIKPFHAEQLRVVLYALFGDAVVEK